MAKSEHHSRSVLRASDEVPDIYCEPCHQNGHVAIAEGYCVDCPEYLCGPCYKIHRGHKALASHVLLDKDSMPLTTDPSRRIVDVCKEKCSIHLSEVIKLFCETCDKVVCTICVATDHRQCENVKHIPDIVKDLNHTEELEKFNEDIWLIANELSNYKEKLQANVTSNKEMGTLAKQELKCQRAQVNRFFDQLEKKMHEQITAIENRNKDKLKAASDRLNYMKTDLDQIKKDMEAKNTEQRCEMFIAMIQYQQKLKTVSNQFDKIQEELRIQRYALLPSEQIQAMMRNITEICRIAAARLESVTNLKTGTDKTDPSIHGLTIVHGHYCVASDDINQSIKVIDTNSKCVASEIAIEAVKIKSLTSVSDDQVAISVYLSSSTNQMQFFTVSQSGIIQRTKTILRFNQHYDVYLCYDDMVHCAGNIYGVLPSRIDKLSMTGKILRTIHPDEKGHMRRIAASPDGQTLYVTHYTKFSVTGMTLDGKVKAVCKFKDLENPVGITVDKHGYVYVCSYGTGNIQQLTADLNKVQVLIDVKCDTITYSSIENKLYISCGNNIIQQYSLDFKNLRQAHKLMLSNSSQSIPCNT